MIFSKNKSDLLLSKIRNGEELNLCEKLNLITQLSIPSILAQITSVLMFFIDASMVGHLGARASAAIGLVESSTWLFGSITNAASLGFSVQVAHFIGANDFQQARQVFRHGLICTFVLSIIIAVSGILVSGHLPFWLGGGADIAHDASMYFLIFMLVMPFFQLSNLSGAMLKSSGDMRIPSVMSIMMCVLDVAFNYIFIYIFNMGVAGAAIGTAISIMVVGLSQGYFAIFRNKFLALSLDRQPFVWVSDYLYSALKISAPMALQSFLMSGAQIVSTIIVAPLGNIAIATNTFAITAESLCYMPGYGIGDAATTLVGQSMGAKRLRLCRNFSYMTVASAMIVMSVMGMVMYVFAPEMMAILSPVNDIQALGTTVLRIEAFAEPFFAASIVAYSAFVGAGDTLRPALINLCSMWFVRLSLAAWLAKDYGLKGVWTAMAIELTFRGILFLTRLFHGRWLKATA